MDVDNLIRDIYIWLTEMYGSPKAALADWKAEEIENLADLTDDEEVDLVFN